MKKALLRIRLFIFEFFYKMRNADFARKIIETFATRIIIIGLSLVTSIMIARILGPEGRGVFALANTIAGIGVQFGNLGLQASNTYYVSKDRKLLGWLLSNSIVVSVLIGGIFAFAIGLVHYIWPRSFPVNELLLLLTILYIPFGIAYLLLQNLLLGIQEIKAYNVIELANKIIILVLISIAVFLNVSSVNMIFSVTVIVLIVSCTLALTSIYKRINKIVPPSKDIFKSSIGYGIRAYLSCLFAFLLIRVNILMVQYLLGNVQVGHYSISMSLFDMLCIFPITVSMLLFPKMSAMNNIRQKWVYIKKIFKIILILMVCSTTIMALLSERIVELLFGYSFLPAVTPFLCLLPGAVAWGMTSILSNFITSEYIPVKLIVMYFLLFLTEIPLAYIFILRWGLIGASITLSLVYLVALVCVFLIAKNM